MGTPSFAADILQIMLDSGEVEVLGVWCQPDRPAGRGHKLTPPATKVLAQKYELPVYQPLNLKDPADQRAIAELEPDFLAVAAYGLILPQAVLDIPRLAPLNVHASILPKYRGAAPIQRAIMSGDEHTGVSIMKIALALDSGPVYANREVQVGNFDSGALQAVLARAGGELLLEIFRNFSGLIPTPQDEALSTYAAKLHKEDGYIDWLLPSQNIHAWIRGVHPAPGARTVLVLPGGEEITLVVGPGLPGEERPQDIPPSSVCILGGNRLAVATADRYYILNEVKPAGKGFMASASFINGYLDCKSGICGHMRKP